MRIAFYLNILLSASILASCGNVFHDMPSMMAQISVIVPPTIEYTFPSNKAVDINKDKSVFISFSKTMDMSPVVDGTFSIQNETDGTPLPSTSITDDKKMVILIPNTQFGDLKDYSVTLTKDLHDSEGTTLPAGYTWRFTSGTEGDTENPRIIGCSPQNGGIIGTENASIWIEVSEDIDFRSVVDGVFTLTEGGTPVTGTPKYTAFIENNTVKRYVIFTPDGPLLNNRQYIATAIQNGIKDLAGKGLDFEYSWNFRTGAVFTDIEAASNIIDGTATFGDLDGAGGADNGYLLRTIDSDVLYDTHPLGSDLSQVFDTGLSGAMAAEMAIRIVEDGKNITDSAGLNLTPVSKLLVGNGLVSPPPDTCYVDPLTGKLALPRPIYWSRMESVENITSPKISIYGYTPAVNLMNTDFLTGQCLFSNGMRLMSAYAAITQDIIYPFGSSGKGDITTGTASFWSYMISHFQDVGSWFFYINDSTYIQGYFGDAGNWIAIVVDGVQRASASGVWANERLDHVYIVWDHDAGLINSKIIKVFINGGKVITSTTPISGNSRIHFVTQEAANIGDGTITTDNLKIWNHVVSEDPSFEYNGGTGRENALHAIYGPNNDPAYDYRPKLDGDTGGITNGVSYYYLP